MAVEKNTVFHLFYVAQDKGRYRVKINYGFEKPSPEELYVTKEFIVE